VRSILVYPSSFRVPDPEGHEEASDGIFSGQTMPQGPVLLSWDQVLEEGRDPSLGRNVVIHEFAHQLDFLDGYHDGTLDWSGEAAERWTEVLNTAYRHLRRRVRERRRTFLGWYASTSKTEFFAVASERFFTRPLAFQRSQPQLYAMLAEAYRVDPGRWFRGKESG
jgi:Mlc titration factor MtfA (ptsG expression regulator)